MDFLIKILYIFLVLIFFKIIYKILEIIQNKVERSIRKNKLRYGIIISRKDLASVNTEVKIKNRILYKLANNSLYPMSFIPYDLIYDDKKAKEEDDFLYWCGELLKDIGYSDIEYVCSKAYKCNDIVCYEGKDSVYVECMLLTNIETDSIMDEDLWEKVDRPFAQKFVGTLLHDQVNKGIIITTGGFSDDAKEYVDSLPKDITVKLIDGYELTKKVRELRMRSRRALPEI
jgi:hypothetical protein